MKVLLRLILGLVIFLISCSKVDFHKTSMPKTEDGVLTKCSSDFTGDNERKSLRFTEIMLNDYLLRSFPDKDFRIEEIHGKRLRTAHSSPLLYVVNFDEGGWAIVSGEVREENQILAYSDKGIFDPENIENPGVKYWYEAALSHMEEVTFEDESNDVSLAQIVIDYNLPYYWVRLNLEPETRIVDFGNVDSLLVTKWGQERPWNSRTPYPDYYMFNHTGCVAVACSQVLYYLKMSKSFNIGLYDVNGYYLRGIDRYISEEGHLYEFPFYYINPQSIERTNYNLNSPKWSQMKLKDDSVDNGSADLVAELMFDVASHVEMKFYEGESDAQLYKTILEPYNVICDSTSYNFNIVRNSLDNGLPVLIGCLDINRGGHAWVIDGYHYKYKITDSPHQWRMIPPDSLRYYSNIDYNYFLTESQKQVIFPEVEEFDIEHNYSPNVEKYLHMNWGWDGCFDDANYSIDPDWFVNGFNFNTRAIIFYDFRQ